MFVRTIDITHSSQSQFIDLHLSSHKINNSSSANDLILEIMDAINFWVVGSDGNDTTVDVQVKYFVSHFFALGCRHECGGSHLHSDTRVYTGIALASKRNSTTRVSVT